MIVNSFRVKNFRGFKDTGDIITKPISLLIGKNSIGKSSYARLFPLLRQGIGIQKRSPLIWNGNLVDFGSFDNAISRYKTDDYIELSFKIKPARSSKNNRSIYKKESLVTTLIKDEVIAKIKLKANHNTESTICDSLSVSFGSNHIDYKFGYEGEIISISFNDIEYITKKDYENYFVEQRIGFLLPIYEHSMKSKNGDIYRAYPPTRMALFRHLKGNLHHRFRTEKIHEICNRINVVGEAGLIFNHCASLPFEYTSWLGFIKKIENDKQKMTAFSSIIHIASSLNLLIDIDNCLERFFSNVSYIQPIRASAERYYRKQELSISSIDSKGANLPFYLNSLSTKKLDELNSWLSETIQIKVKIDTEAGHVMIKVVDDTSGRTDNIADMGFGFSQILPLAVQAWISKTGNKRITSNQKNILVWEQPELHLHPAMQRKLAQLIAKTIENDTDSNISFFIETHSMSIVNEFGDLILSDVLDKDDVDILLFQQDQDLSTSVKKTSFNEDGELDDFPIGFLSV